MDVYIVAMYSTGERWHTFVCASNRAVRRTLEMSYGMSPEPNNSMDAEYQDYRNYSDISQTATVQRVRLIE